MSDSGNFQIIIKPTAGGAKFTVEINPSMTVGELKEEVSKVNNVPAAEQRLIYKGQVLKDERTVVGDYGALLFLTRVYCR
jgi:ubiquilin